MSVATTTETPGREVIVVPSRVLEAELRAETGLALQHDMMMISWSMAMIAGLSLVVTTIGVWLLKGTLEETRKAVQQTADANEAMLEQNRLTEMAQRAWVSAKEVSYLEDGRLRIKFFNSGNTPAYGFFSAASGSFDPFELQEMDTPEASAVRGQTIFPQGGHSQVIFGPINWLPPSEWYVKIAAAYLLPDESVHRLENYCAVSANREVRLVSVGEFEEVCAQANRDIEDVQGE